jgi:CRISPR-associated protein Cmr6
MDGYGQNWKLDENKREFLSYVASFDGGKADYPEFFRRRAIALELSGVGTKYRSLTTTSRLACGLGLPHPAETSILFDRLTGVPYLPGSSVKGMLKSAARLAADGEFPNDVVSEESAKYWKANLDRIFGPEMKEKMPLAKGRMVFYDAFPEKWLKLNLDVLTPHYGPYYIENKVPGDWFNPVPVYFLVVPSNETFRFWYRSLAVDEATKEVDEAAVWGLLPVALDWLGIGGKKSSGYGMFAVGQGDFGAAFPVERQESIPRPAGSDSRRRFQAESQVPPNTKGLPVQKPPKSQKWEKCLLGYHLGELAVFKGKNAAVDTQEILSKALQAGRLEADAVLATVEVITFGTQRRIIRVLDLKPKK